MGISCCLWLLLLTMACTSSIAVSQLVPAMFIFGDSLVDAGNNNYIPSLARSNFYPYGIDFPLGPTGRFSNGRTVFDVLGQALGLPFIPAYLNPHTKGAAILYGVNYASAAGGILDSSGKNYVARLSFSTQIENFKFTLIELKVQLGSADSMGKFLSRALFAVGLGSNDYLNNYLINTTGLSRMYTPDQYRSMVALSYAEKMRTLYQLGGRKFLIAGVGPLGCIPNVLATKSEDGNCVEYINELVQGFNSEVLQLVNRFNADPQFNGATFVYGKAYDVFFQILAEPSRYGFTDAKNGCCGVGKFRGQLTCLPPLAQLCPNRRAHVFWDAFHPTDAANVIVGEALFSGDASATVPMNVQELALL